MKKDAGMKTHREEEQFKEEKKKLDVLRRKSEETIF